MPSDRNPTEEQCGNCLRFTHNSEKTGEKNMLWGEIKAHPGLLEGESNFQITKQLMLPKVKHLALTRLIEVPH